VHKNIYTPFIESI